MNGLAYSVPRCLLLVHDEALTLRNRTKASLEACGCIVVRQDIVSAGRIFKSSRRDYDAIVMIVDGVSDHASKAVVSAAKGVNSPLFRLSSRKSSSGWSDFEKWCGNAIPSQKDQDRPMKRPQLSVVQSAPIEPSPPEETPSRPDDGVVWQQLAESLEKEVNELKVERRRLLEEASRLRNVKPTTIVETDPAAHARAVKAEGDVREQKTEIERLRKRVKELESDLESATEARETAEAQAKDARRSVKGGTAAKSVSAFRVLVANNVMSAEEVLDRVEELLR